MAGLSSGTWAYDVARHALARVRPRESVFVFARPKSDGTVGLWAYDALGRWAALHPAGTPPIAVQGLGAAWQVLAYDPTTAAFFFVNVKRANSLGFTGGIYEGDVETWLYRFKAQ